MCSFFDHEQSLKVVKRGSVATIFCSWDFVCWCFRKDSELCNKKLNFPFHCFHLYLFMVCHSMTFFNFTEFFWCWAALTGLLYSWVGDCGLQGLDWSCMYLWYTLKYRKTLPFSSAKKQFLLIDVLIWFQTIKILIQ